MFFKLTPLPPPPSQISLQPTSPHLFSFVLDGTECPINRPSPHIQEVFYSGKSGQHSIKYEVGVHPETGFLVWVGGPTPGSVHDLTLARMSGVLRLLGENDFILADKGYVGEFNIITPFKGKNLSDDEKKINRILGSIQWIVEHIIG